MRGIDMTGLDARRARGGGIGGWSVHSLSTYTDVLMMHRRSGRGSLAGRGRSSPCCCCDVGEWWVGRKCLGVRA